MQHWTKIKEDTKPGNLQKMIDDMLKNKRDSQKDGIDYAKQKKQKEQLEAKVARHRERQIQKQEKLQADSKDSYLNIEQF